LSVNQKTEKFRSLAVTLATGFSVLTMAALVIATTLQMYFSFQAQQKIILTNQKLIARMLQTLLNILYEKNLPYWNLPQNAEIYRLHRAGLRNQPLKD
jgi:hypothetical protein